MRTVIMCLLALLVSGNALAQRLNALGQKMVSRIEITYYNNSGKRFLKTVDYQYDSNDLLMGLTYVEKPLDYEGETKRRVIQRKNGTLERKDYEPYTGYKPSTYRYEMSGNRITKIEEYNYDLDGSRMRFDFDFEYDDTYNDEPKLNSITYTWYTSEAGSKIFEKREGLQKDISLFRFEDGNFNRSLKMVSPRGTVSEAPFKEGVFIYDQIEDDTNINWNYLVLNYIRCDGGFRMPEFFTEWVGLHSFNHLIGLRDGSYYYNDLEYIYDCDNLSKIIVYRFSERSLYMEVSVSYVE